MESAYVGTTERFGGKSAAGLRVFAPTLQRPFADSQLS